MMTPTASILALATASQTVIDADGRRLEVRRLTALDKLRLFKVAGPSLSQNEMWLGMAMLAYSVAAIDDIPLPIPVSELQIEALVGRLGDAGISAVAQALQQTDEDTSTDRLADAGN